MFQSKIKGLVFAVRSIGPLSASHKHKLRAQKRYRTVGIGSSAAYCDGKNVELVIAALNRGGSVRPACAYWNQLLERWEKDKDKPRHAAAQSRLLSSRLISALD